MKCSACTSLQDTTSLLLCINPCVCQNLSVCACLSRVCSLLVMSSSKEVSVKCSQVPGGGVTEISTRGWRGKEKEGMIFGYNCYVSFIETTWKNSLKSHYWPIVYICS